MSGIVVINTNGDILYANHEIIDNIHSLPTSVSSIIETILACSEKEAQNISQKVLAGETHQTRLTGITDGQERTYLVEVKPFFENGIITSLGIIHTEEHKTQTPGRDSLNWFLSTMSHELRTPLIGILGSTDLLLQSKLNNYQVENLEIVRDCGEKLLDIINEILNISELELGLVNVSLAIGNTLDIFTEVAAAIEPAITKKGLKLKLDLPAKMPVNLLTDQPKLSQILSGLLNAVVKIAHKGDILLKANFREEADQETWLYVTVANTGKADLYDEIKQVSNPFEDGNLVANDGEKAELGQYVCKKLIDLLKGEIWIDKNHGATSFHFKLPVQTIARQGEQPTGADNTYKQVSEDLLMTFNPPKILVVEDNSLNEKIVSQMLQTYGFEVSSVSNGLECLNILLEKDFDVILMDMQMPLMDGYETTRFINQDDNYRNIPIIAVTANAMIGDREKCLAAGCVAYIAKPFKIEELVQEIKKYLGKKPLPKQKKEKQSTLSLTELIPEFIESLADMVDDLVAAAEEKNFEKIQDISHDIKGTAGMYGFMKISNAAALIEQATRLRNKENIISLIRQLHNLFEQTSAQVS